MQNGIGLSWSLDDGLAGPPVWQFLFSSNVASGKSDKSNGYTVKLV